MIVILSGSKSDTSINNNLKKEKKRFKQKISKKNAVRVKIIIKNNNAIPPKNTYNYQGRS
jgi:hypothetical protein